ncbi:MAG: hypothetical protein R2747_18695 [Pyrinomonadaceae bacterium]
MPKKIRTIILEIQRTQVLRRRSRSKISYCEECGGEGDFLSLPDAAALFGVEQVKLFQFIHVNAGHYRPDTNDTVYICLNSLLRLMNRQTAADGKVRMIGER